MLKLTMSSKFPFPSKTITQLAWRPSKRIPTAANGRKLAIASEDGSLRIYSYDLEATT